MKNPKDKTPSNPPPSAESLSSHLIREEYSMEEIAKMLTDIDSLISSYKAEQKGIDPENMVKTIRGGHVVWITIDEMNAILSKKRRIVKSQMIQRSIRGENNISSEIQKRIEACRSLIDAIRKIAPKESADFSSQMRNLESLQNITTSKAHDLYVLESAIQRKRQEDPLIQEFDCATKDIVQSLQKNKLDDIEINQSYCDRHMEEYLAKQKRLEPYLKKAGACRLELIQKKQQLYQFQFDLIDQGLKMLSGFLDDILYFDKQNVQAPVLIKSYEEIRSLLNNAKPIIHQLADYPPEKLQEDEHLFLEADTKYLTPLLTKTVLFVESFQEAWNLLVIKKETIVSTQKPQESEAIHSSKRMVFQESQEKSE